GLQQPWAAVFGVTAALPAMAQTCLSSQGTPSIQAATGWAVKPLSVCRRDRHGRVNLPTTGRLRIGSVSITAILISEASARRSSMCLELHLRSLCSLWEKIAMLTCSTAIISAVFPGPLTRLTWEELTEGYLLSLTIRAKERILVFITTPAGSGPIRLLRQIRLRSRLAGAKIRTGAARPGSRRPTAQTI